MIQNGFSRNGPLPAGLSAVCCGRITFGAGGTFWNRKGRAREREREEVVKLSVPTGIDIEDTIPSLFSPSGHFQRKKEDYSR
ncbi:hypothetical protein AND_001340 [Anopheles darlingi]|uniref:Uncharacterized protein n=1 Tax=Anopheles darlingi TaxID=43151 RepID=W5JV90_ANODA|nr:hypothetical protein AND_001340 [Anopheles darlingi]